MQKENRLIQVEILPQGPDKRKKGMKAFESWYEKGEKPSQSLEALRTQIEEQNEADENAQRVLESIEQMRLECPRCGSKNINEDKEKEKTSNKAEKTQTIPLKCLSCKYRWDETI